MSHIKSRKHAAAGLLVAALPGLAAAQQSAAPEAPQKAEEQTLPALKATATRQNDYKADTASNPKFTQPLLDTPQTITVIKKELLQQQGATTLGEALRNTPGITFQMGENGNTQTGDSIFMRGFDTQQSIFVDGIRDIGTVSRDVFNLDAVEVVKGPAGADIGRGSPTGYVNLSTKAPQADSFSAGSLTLGSGDKRRLTADLNQAVPALGAGTALRLNLLAEDSGAVKRNAVENQRFGFAPSIAFGLNSPTRATLYYLHVNQNNRPDGGIPAIGLPGYYNAIFDPAPSTAFPTGGTLAGQTPARVNLRNYYGSLNDHDKVRADMITARIEHTLSPGVTLRNIARFGRTEQQYALTGINAVTFTTPSDPSTWTVSRSRQGKDQENQILTNQSGLTAEFGTGAVQHTLVTGLELMHEKQKNHTLAIPTGTTQAAANLYHPRTADVFQPLVRTGASVDGNTTTAAVYAFDTLKFSEAWQVTAGLRWEKYKTETTSVATTGVATPLAKADDLLTGKLGVVFKPAANGSLYAAYATSQKPPGSDSFTLNATATNINSPTLEPAKATSAEVGTKWELFDNRMAVTAALFRSEVKNDVVDTDIAGNPVQLGKKTVQGIELGAAGMITPAWQLSAGLAWMDTEVNATTAASAGQVGNGLAWSPKLTFTSWTTYKLPFGLTLGGGARFVDSQVRNSNTVTPTTTNVPRIPSYWVFDAMAAYEISKNVSLQLNLYNLADKFYIQSLNNGGSRFTLGAPRSATLTANVAF